MLSRRYSVLTALLVVFTAAASEVSAQGPVLGAKLGASWSNFSIDTDEVFEQSKLTSLMGGGFIRFDLGRIGLQPELMVVTKGSEVEDSEADVKLKLDYVEVPVLLYVPLMQSGVSPYLIGGPAVAFEIGCNAEAAEGGVEVSVECDGGDFLPDRKKVDLGAIAGAGISLPMGPGAALVEGRYTFGFSKITEDVDGSAKNRSLGVMVGYSIPLGR